MANHYTVPRTNARKRTLFNIRRRGNVGGLPDRYTSSREMTGRRASIGRIQEDASQVIWWGPRWGSRCLRIISWYIKPGRKVLPRVRVRDSTCKGRGSDFSEDSDNAKRKLRRKIFLYFICQWERSGMAQWRKCTVPMMSLCWPIRDCSNITTVFGTWEYPKYWLHSIHGQRYRSQNEDIISYGKV